MLVTVILLPICGTPYSMQLIVASLPVTSASHRDLRIGCHLGERGSEGGMSLSPSNAGLEVPGAVSSKKPSEPSPE